MKKIGAVAYRLQLPPKAQIHNVFYVVFLKKFEGTSPTEPIPLPPIIRGRAVAQPDRVVRARSAGSSWEILIQWKGKSMAEATWEPLQQFKEDYPDVKLKDELFRQEGVVLWTPSSVVSMLGNIERSTTKSRCVMEIESKLIRKSLSC
jgi:hypothetical protein